MRHKIYPPARQALKDIWIYTKRTWGEQQADAYIAGLPTAFEKVAENRFLWHPVLYPDAKGVYAMRYEQRQTNKQPAHAQEERDGRKYSRVLASVIANSLRKNIDELVDKTGTQEHKACRKIDREFKGEHHTVEHGIDEYAKKDGSHIITAESPHALIKRGMHGVFHHCSKVHLQRDFDEFDFRWNCRAVTDVERAVAAIKQAEGKRLTYASPSIF